MRTTMMLSAIGLALYSISSAALAAVNVGINIGSPAPVVVAQPSPVVVAPGWQGDRYWDGKRYWNRREWEERGRPGHHHGHGDDERHEGHCPPGQAKKGRC